MVNEKGVSPVIGVILMVAITVILAAVIASFVFGMSTSVKKTYNVAVTAVQNGNNVIVTLAGGSDVPSLDWVGVNCTRAGETASMSSTFTELSVGASVTLACGSGGADRVLVTAGFKDGTQQILLDTFV